MFYTLCDISGPPAQTEDHQTNPVRGHPKNLGATSSER